MTLWLAIALGSATGGVARFWLGAMIDARHGGVLPLGTLVVNITGAALIGVLAALPLGALAYAGLVTGLLGSYTTVSSFSLQVLQLLQHGRGRTALALVTLSMASCLAAALAGLALGTWVFR